MRIRFFTFLMLLLCFISIGLSGQSFRSTFFMAYDFLEPFDIRQQLSDYLISSAFVGRSAPQRVFYSEVTNADVQFRVLESSRVFYQLIIPEYNGLFPVYCRGTYIIRRNMDTGVYEQIKIFLKNNEGTYARIFNDDNRAVLQVYLYGRKIADDIILAVPFLDLLTLPFTEVARLSANRIDWNRVWPEYDPLHAVVRDMAVEVAGHLPDLKDADDGAINSDGKYVYIYDGSIQQNGGLNCSGFAKWVADGIFSQKSGLNMNIEALKTRHLAERGTRFSSQYEHQRDPYFGLDWIRNIAVKLNGGNVRDHDITFLPYHQAVPDVGFPVGELESVMYQLALEYPGYFYLGSINQEFGRDPVLRQHIHVAVFFTFLDSKGELRVRVMERNNEYSLSSLEQRYPSSFVHLVRIPASRKFKPFEFVTNLE